MKKRLSVFLLCLPLVVFSKEPLKLEHTEYLFKATHEFKHPPVGFPGDELPDKGFKPAKAVTEYTITVLKGGQRIKIMPGAIQGEIAKALDHKRIYYLDEGLFAGGTFNVVKAGKGCSATLVEFGSGEPVVRAVRGSLTPKK